MARTPPAAPLTESLPPPPPAAAGSTTAAPHHGKDWDRHVRQADELSRTPGFQDLRDRIVAKAAPGADDCALDVGCGTGLLALAMAPRCASVWAIDNAPAMVDHLRWMLAGQAVANVYPLIASASSLPQMDSSVDVVVSNYCFHHLDERGKRDALAEAMRVLRPGGRLVFGDMMFSWTPAEGRNRAVVWSKVRAIARRGPAGWMRLLRNAGRMLIGRGERPASPDWWRIALLEAGFDSVEIEVLAHEGGIASAIKPG
ncbi:MAG: class I SAM-dependent methyltransferase [Actinobacteria bacterium]|nr:class I SAM-dependent methyltransferase [Actinomycetota bacterium]